MIITPNFHFDRNCKEAIEFYQNIFDAEVLCLFENKDANPKDFQSDSEHKKHIYHSEMLIGKTRIMMSDVLGELGCKSGNLLSLVITYDSAEEVRATFEKFTGNIKILSPVQSTTYSSCFVSFIDKFGMRWEFMTEQTEK